VSDVEHVLLEMRLFTVHPGVRDEFDRISREGTIPLMRRLGINVVAHGPAMNNENGWYLLRAFSSEEQRKEQAEVLYSSAEWEENFDTPVMAMIDDYRISVMPATAGLVREFAAQSSRIPEDVSGGA
jgi:hypothetical protein